jgi:hypothetical protein
MIRPFALIRTTRCDGARPNHSFRSAHAFHGLRSSPPRLPPFLIVWAAQSLSVIGSGMTGFALHVYLAQVLYPAPEQKAELALALLMATIGANAPTSRGPVLNQYAR